MIKAVIFDLDDTLAPEISYVKSGYRAVATKLSSDIDSLGQFINLPTPGYTSKQLEDLMWELFSESSQNVFNRLFERLNLSYDRDDVMSLVKVYREHMPDSNIYKLYPDVAATLTDLRQRGISLGIISDGFSKAQHNKATALNLDDYFSEIIFTADYGDDYKKPSGKAFELIASRLNVRTDELMYVGDNPAKDFYIKSYIEGITTVRVMRKDGVYQNTPYRDNIMEDYRIDDLQSLWQKIS